MSDFYIVDNGKHRHETFYSCTYVCVSVYKNRFVLYYVCLCIRDVAKFDHIQKGDTVGIKRIKKLRHTVKEFL